MTPTTFEESNRRFRHPDNMDETQCGTLSAYVGKVEGPSSVHGTPIIVTAWTPNEAERTAIAMGGPIFITFLGSGLPPHFATTTFVEAVNPA